MTRWVWALALWLAAGWAPQAAAPPADEVSGMAFLLEIAAGGLGAVGGALAGELPRIALLRDAGGVLGATLGAGALSFAFRGKANLLTGLAGAAAGWYLFDYFAVGMFAPGAPLQFNVLGQSMRFDAGQLRLYARALGAGFLATLGVNIYL